MFRLRNLFFGITLMPSAYAQTPPSDSDSDAYKAAYVLVCDLETRAKKAESLLLDNGRKKLSELNHRELSLLCKVYSEANEFNKQYEVAKEMWKMDPNAIDSGLWMESSLINQIGKSTTPEMINAFVDSALNNGKGNRRILLILKARSVLLRDGVPDTNKKKLAQDAMVEASQVPIPDNIQTWQIAELLPEVIIENDPLFKDYFTPEELTVLKLRLTQFKNKIRK